MPPPDPLILSPAYFRVFLAFVWLGTSGIVVVNLLRVGKPHAARATVASVLAFATLFPQVASYRSVFPAAHTSMLVMAILYALTTALVWLSLARPGSIYRPPPPPPEANDRFLW